MIASVRSVFERGRLGLGFVLLVVLLMLGVSAGAAPDDHPAWQAPQLVKNLAVQTGDSYIEVPIEMGEHLYFVFEGIWRTDGTPAGTEKIENLSPVNRNMQVRGDELFFLADHPDYGREIWTTEGAPGQAEPIGDLFLWEHDSSIDELTTAGQHVFFRAYDAVFHDQLWRTDGTAAGTIRLTGGDKTLNAPYPEQLVDLNGTLYFIYADANYFKYLAKSDGTAAGTQMVKQIGSEPINYDISEFVQVGDLLYFTVGTENGHDLWRTDGTAAGTIKLFSFPVVTREASLIAGDSILYVITLDLEYDSALWKSGGTAATTAKVTDLPFHYTGVTATVGNRLFMRCDTIEHGGELWTSDGTAAGTKLVKDILPGEESSDIYELVAVGNEVFFGAEVTTDSTIRRLWRSDGTGAGTVEVPLGLPAGFNPDAKAVAAFDGRLLAHIADPDRGREPWLVDPATGKATFLADLEDLDTAGSSPRFLHRINDLLIFAANGHLWRTDGTDAGTTMVYQAVVNQQELVFNPDFYAVVGNHLYFFVDDVQKDHLDLWRSDGTVAGTKMVKDNLVRDNTADGVQSMTDVNGALYFSRVGYTNRAGGELWRSDGTAAGTIHVATPHITPFEASSEINWITGVGNTAFFAATDGVNGVELWRSDGTTAGTVMLKDIRPGVEGSGPTQLTTVGSRVFFFADDGVHGRELWRSDGTAAGTVMVKDIRPGAASSEPSELVLFNGRAYFVADDGAHGREVWRSDGTAAGTVLVKDIHPSATSDPYDLTPGDAYLYFFAEDIEAPGKTGLNPYRTDGTAAGTIRLAIHEYDYMALPEMLTAVGDWAFYVFNERLFQIEGTSGVTIEVSDVHPEFSAYNIMNLTSAGDRLFFTATHAKYGNELFVKHTTLYKLSPSVLYMPEGDAYTTFHLQLTAKPSQPVTVKFASDDPTVTVSPTTVTITPQNWQTPAKVGVRAADDGQAAVRQATLTMTFESADASLNGTVIELPLNIGWRFGFVPVVGR